MKGGAPTDIPFVLDLSLKEWGMGQGGTIAGIGCNYKGQDAITPSDLDDVVETLVWGGGLLKNLGSMAKFVTSRKARAEMMEEKNNCLTSSLFVGTAEGVAKNAKQVKSKEWAAASTHRAILGELNNLQGDGACEQKKFDFKDDRNNKPIVGNYVLNWKYIFAYRFEKFRDKNTLIISGHHNNLKGTLLKLKGYTIGSEYKLGVMRGGKGTGLMNCAVVKITISGQGGGNQPKVTSELIYPGEVEDEEKWDYIGRKKDGNVKNPWADHKKSVEQPILQAWNFQSRDEAFEALNAGERIEIFIVRHGAAFHNKINIDNEEQAQFEASDKEVQELTLKKIKKAQKACVMKELNSSLTKEGRAQAQRAGETMFNKHEFLDLDKLLILSSPLTRTIETIILMLKYWADKKICTDSLIDTFEGIAMARCAAEGDYGKMIENTRGYTKKCLTARCAGSPVPKFYPSTTDGLRAVSFAPSAAEGRVRLERYREPSTRTTSQRASMSMSDMTNLGNLEEGTWDASSDDDDDDEEEWEKAEAAAAALKASYVANRTSSSSGSDSRFVYSQANRVGEEEWATPGAHGGTRRRLKKSKRKSRKRKLKRRKSRRRKTRKRKTKRRRRN